MTRGTRSNSRLSCSDPAVLLEQALSAVTGTEEVGPAPAAGSAAGRLQDRVGCVVCMAGTSHRGVLSAVGASSRPPAAHLATSALDTRARYELHRHQRTWHRLLTAALSIQPGLTRNPPKYHDNSQIHPNPRTRNPCENTNSRTSPSSRIQRWPGASPIPRHSLHLSPHPCPSSGPSAWQC